MKVETMGSVNMWASQVNISGALPLYCGNESYAFTYDANFDYATPVCTDLPLSAVVDKATQQLFIASSILTTRTRQLAATRRRRWTPGRRARRRRAAATRRSGP